MPTPDKQIGRCGAASWQIVGRVSLNPAYAQKTSGGSLLFGCKLLTASDTKRTLWLTQGRIFNRHLRLTFAGPVAAQIFNLWPEMNQR